jgi:hypothetical protein
MNEQTLLLVDTGVRAERGIAALHAVGVVEGAVVLRASIPCQR